ncbi:MAG: hypothetical protein ACLUNV_10590 [Sutterella wadsworthensis]
MKTRPPAITMTACPPPATRTGRAFRDVELEQRAACEEAWKIGLGAQFGGK